MSTLMLTIAVTIFILTIVFGISPFLKKSKGPKLLRAEALANGVFLGAGLIHMLPDAAQSFSSKGLLFPWPFLICGLVFLLLLSCESSDYFRRDNHKSHSLMIALSSTLILSIHSFCAGVALGSIGNVHLLFVLFAAIVAHKWAASFSLSTYINKTSLSFKYRITLFFVFSLSLPLGMLLGYNLQSHYATSSLIEPVFLAIAAGTFIYLGTFHSYKNILDKKHSNNLVQYINTLLGFSVMAAVAVWL